MATQEVQMRDGDLLRELAPVAEGLLERHLKAAKEWFPHELVPWSRGRDFEPGEAWDADEFPLDDAVRSALLVNLLTEDNLPYYFRTIEGFFGPDHPWAEWTRRWTAEEARHSIVIRDYLTVTRAVDPVDLERGRMRHMSTGFDGRIEGAAQCLVYVTLQELATRIAHRNTGKLVGDRAGYEVMARVAADENLHHLFYRDIVTAALDIDPSTMMLAIEAQVRGFEMPGAGIDDFRSHAKRIAGARIYDFATHHQQILLPVVLHHWRVEHLERLSPEAEEARGRLVRHVERVGRVGERLLERQQEAGAPLQVAR